MTRGNSKGIRLRNPKTYGVPGKGKKLDKKQGDKNVLFQETGAPGDKKS